MRSLTLDPALWSGKKLVKSGVWDIMLAAALNDKKSAHLHDELPDDEQKDIDYIPRGRKPTTGARS